MGSLGSFFPPLFLFFFFADNTQFDQNTLPHHSTILSSERAQGVRKIAFLSFTASSPRGTRPSTERLNWRRAWIRQEDQAFGGPEGQTTTCTDYLMNKTAGWGDNQEGSQGTKEVYLRNGKMGNTLDYF
jgi:hypothetical protein